MVKFAVFALIAGLIGSAFWLVVRAIQALSKVDYAYVRFRNGILTLERTIRGNSVEVSFRPSAEFQEFSATQLAGFGDRARWYLTPSGELVKTGSEESEAIGRTLRYAKDAGLLEAEISTE